MRPTLHRVFLWEKFVTLPKFHFYTHTLNIVSTHFRRCLEFTSDNFFSSKILWVELDPAYKISVLLTHLCTVDLHPYIQCLPYVKTFYRIRFEFHLLRYVKRLKFAKYFRTRILPQSPPPKLWNLTMKIVRLVKETAHFFWINLLDDDHIDLNV